MLPFYAFLMRKPWRGHCFFQSSDKKATCLTRTQTKILRIFEKQRIKLDFFVNFLKKRYFLDFKTTAKFFDFIFQFWRSAILLCRTVYLFFQVPLCNQPTIVLRHWKRYQTGTFKPYSTLLRTIGFSSMIYIKLWRMKKNALKI